MSQALNGGGLLSRTGMMPTARGGLVSGATSVQSPTPTTGATGAMQAGGGLLSRTGKFPLMGSGTGMLPVAPHPMVAPAEPGMFAPFGVQTGQLPPGDSPLKTTTASLTAFN